jgi:hypothetical protein
MKQGTWSVLFGCHSQIHSLMVYIAWIKLYHRLPNFMETVCIILHDIGHLEKNYLDNYDEKKRHAELGARIAGFLFGGKGYDLIIGHNAYTEKERSRLYEPDKYSWLIAPVWWMITNTWFEPKLQRRGSTRKESAIMFKEGMKENWNTGLKKQGHDIYLEQW